MRIRNTATRSVHPVIAAIAIVLVLGAVQYVWWMKLVHRPTSRNPGGGGGGSPGAPPVPFAAGRKDVLVTTVAGRPEPGQTDGPGYAAQFDGPSAVAVDAGGNLFVADTRNHRIRLISTSGKTSTLAGREPGYRDGPVTEALFNSPSGIAVSRNGTVFVADSGNNRIRAIKGAMVTTVAGGQPGFSDGPAANARFNLPTSLAIGDVQGEERAIFIADSGNRRIRRLDLKPGALAVSTVTLDAGIVTGVAVKNGVVAFSTPERGKLTIGSESQVKPAVDLGEDNGRFKKDALTLHRPAALCGDSQGWYVVDASHGAILMVRPGAAYVIAGYCTGGSAAKDFQDNTGDRARFGSIAGITSDGKGHIYAADTTNNAIRKITIPASLNSAEPSRGTEIGF